MKNALQNKRGNSYVWLCVVVLVASMLFSVLLLYMSLTAQVGIQKRETQAKLDGYLAAFAAGEYNALKRGADYEQYLAWERLEQGVYPVLGFENDTDETVADPNGNYTATRPTVTVLRGDGFGLTVRYTVSFPVKWNGRTFADLTVPVTVSSYYRTK